MRTSGFASTSLLLLAVVQSTAAHTYPDGSVSLFSPGFFGLGHITPFQKSFATGVAAEGGAIAGAVGFVAEPPLQEGAGESATFFDPHISQVITLPHVGDGPGNGEANAISANGSIKVGFSGNADGIGGACFWNASNTVKLLAQGPTTVYAVTPDGSVAAGHTFEFETQIAALWSIPGGSLTKLAHLPGYTDSNALAISANGQIIVGRAFNNATAIGGGAPDRLRAVRWVLGTPPEDLGTLTGFSDALVFGISSDGSTVVGQCLRSGDSHGFVWTRESGMRPLLSPQSQSTQGHAVSSTGKYIVGNGGEDVGAIRWTQDGTTDGAIRELLRKRSVDTGGWHLAYATGMSQDGQTICGVGINPSGKTEAWIAVIPEILHPPIVKSPSIQTVSAGEPFVLEISASGNPTKYAAKGLPKGFGISATSGRITGLWSRDEAQPGIYTIVVTATNADGSGTGSFQLILPPPEGFQKAIQGLGFLPKTQQPDEPISNLSFGNGLSPNGRVAVGQDGVANDARAYFWTAGEGMSGLPRLDGALRSYSTALAISADGNTIVGQAAAAPAADGSNRSVAVVWKRTGASTPPVFETINIGLFSGGIISLAEAVSADGSVVVGYGDAKDPDPNYIYQVYEAFRWTENEGMLGLGFLDAGKKLTIAHGVSADGTTVVGAGDSADGYQAFRWTEAEGLVALGKVSGALSSTAYAISADKTAIIGVSTFDSQNDNRRAFRWTAADGMVDLGVVPGDQFSEAKAISADGSIVVGRSGVDFTSRAFLWDQANGMRDLQAVLAAENPDLANWTVRSATGISADGTVITGVGTNPTGDTEAFIAYLDVQPARLLNISTRTRVLTGDNVLIGGFIVTGTGPKKVIIRGIGPSLVNSEVSGVLADPTLELHQGGAILATNDNWKEHQAEVEATTIAPANELESAIVTTLDPGSYTAILADKNGGSGIGVVEVYDLAQASGSTLANISSRGFVDAGDNVMIGGVIIGGGSGIGSATVLVRGIGPALASAGVADPLQDPTLELFNGNGTSLASNDDWMSTQKSEIEASMLGPVSEQESALLATLAPGNYTAIVRGKGQATGVGLVEVYNIQ